MNAIFKKLLVVFALLAGLVTLYLRDRSLGAIVPASARQTPC
jgi:hypothetical protein